MVIEERLQDAVARCVTALRRYHFGERTSAAKAKMTAEIDLLVGWLLELHLPPGVAQAEILIPVETYLFARYGHEVGSRLNAEFIEAFEANGMALLARDGTDGDR